MARGYRTAFSPLREFRDEMDRLVTGVFGQMPAWTLPATVRGQPALNVWETPDAVVVETEVPGLKSDQLDISVAGDELRLQIERPDLAEEGAKYHRRERPVGTFARTLRLPAEVDSGAVQAELHDGVLRITLPKAPAARPRKIQVATAK